MLTENTFPKNVWGPCAWHLLHAISIGNNKEIKEKNKNAYIIFYKTFGYILPCVICKEHYKNLFGIFHKINYDIALINGEGTIHGSTNKVSQILNLIRRLKKKKHTSYYI